MSSYYDVCKYFKLENTTFRSPITAADNAFSIASILNIVEVTCIAWFTFEFLIRMLTAPILSKFLRDFLNIIDLLCILPFYFGLFLSEYAFFMKIKYILQMLRVLRLLKLSRYSDGIKAFAYALKISSKALFYLLVLLLINVFLFSSFVYFVEQENPDTAYKSILAAFWWAIITSTTVGYGVSSYKPKIISKIYFSRIVFKQRLSKQLKMLEIFFRARLTIDCILKM